MKHRRSARGAAAKRLCGLAAVLPLALPVTALAAEDDPVTVGAQPSWVLAGGLTTGGTVALDRRGWFGGGELSLSRVRQRSFVGGYLDGYYDFAARGTYLTLGPRVGVLRPSKSTPIGLALDAGPALRLAQSPRIGASARIALVLMGMVSLYGRTLVFDAPTQPYVVQVGITLKFPLFSPFGKGAR